MDKRAPISTLAVASGEEVAHFLREALLAISNHLTVAGSFSGLWVVENAFGAPALVLVPAGVRPPFAALHVFAGARCEQIADGHRLAS